MRWKTSTFFENLETEEILFSHAAVKVFRDGALTVAVENRVLRDGAEVARLAHNQEAEGSIPSPATKFRLDIITPVRVTLAIGQGCKQPSLNFTMDEWASGLCLQS